MTVEQIELRKILTQMLADNGINRETIKGFVEEIVSEKVDRAIDRIIHETNMDSLIARQVQDTIRTTISDEVRWNVRRVLGSVSISLETHGSFRGGESDGKGGSVGCPEKSCQTGSFRTGCKEPRPDRLCHSAV